MGDNPKGTWAVFPGVGSATNAARRLAAKLTGSTTRALDGGNSVVEVQCGDRRVTITCPPSTAYVVEMYAAEARVDEKRTVDDAEALALATAWLDG